MKLFEYDKDTKDIVLDISALFGVKSEVVKQVWEMTVLAMLLKTSDFEDSKTVRLKIPFIGNMLLRDKGSVIENGKCTPDIECFVSLDENFKQLFDRARYNDFDNLSEYVQDKYLSDIIDKID